MRTLGQNWIGVTSRNHCPICDKPDWCLVSRDGEAVLCPRIQKGSVKNLGDAGYLHLLCDNTLTPENKQSRIEKTIRSIPVKKTKSDINWEDETMEAKKLLTKERLGKLANDLGVKHAGLLSLHFGWSEELQAFSIPMSDAMGDFVGIQLRFLNGSKRFIPGSTVALFVPDNVTGDGYLCVCEGASDTAAMIGLGFDAIGRFNCNHGAPLVKAWLQKGSRRNVAVFADSNKVGVEGATKLARHIRPVTSTVRVVKPSIFKDARELARRRPRAFVLSLIDNAKRI